jgi:DNA-binding response OmpR family regulator
VIDRRRGNVLRDQQVINVTPTELRLFTYLAQHPNQVLSREQILEAVWGYDHSPETEQVVTVNICRLREKIERDPSRPTVVLTVPGFGYKLVHEYLPGSHTPGG